MEHSICVPDLLIVFFSIVDALQFRTNIMRKASTYTVEEVIREVTKGMTIIQILRTTSFG